jgi:hypothetical protein
MLALLMLLSGRPSIKADGPGIITDDQRRAPVTATVEPAQVPVVNGPGAADPLSVGTRAKVPDSRWKWRL